MPLGNSGTEEIGNPSHVEPFAEEREYHNASIGLLSQPSTYVGLSSRKSFFFIDFKFVAIRRIPAAS